MLTQFSDLVWGEFKAVQIIKIGGGGKLKMTQLKFIIKLNSLHYKVKNDV